MTTGTCNGKTIWKESLWKALLASFLFLLLSLFQGKDIVRENFEDAAFDVVNRVLFSTRKQDTDSKNVVVFAFDNAYMKQQKLFDKNNNPDYGYILPREKIAQFIEDLDNRLSFNKVSTPHRTPKALLIDFDLSFPSGANGELSDGDLQLLNG